LPFLELIVSGILTETNILLVNRDHYHAKGKPVTVNIISSIKKREVTASYMNQTLPFKKMTTGKHVHEAMSILYDNVGSDCIPYMALAGSQIGVVLAVPEALEAYSIHGGHSILVLDHADSKLRSQRLSLSDVNKKTKFKALYIGMRTGDLTVNLFIGLVDLMSAQMTTVVVDSIHQRMLNKKYSVPHPPVIVIDGALGLLESVVAAYTPYKVTADYMILTMKGLFNKFRPEIVNNPLVYGKPSTCILRCYFHFKHQIFRYFRSAKKFACVAGMRKQMEHLAELIFDSFYCGSSINEVFGTMVAVYSLLRAENIQLCISMGEETVVYPIDIECLEVICWNDGPLQSHILEYVKNKSLAQLTPLFTVRVEKFAEDTSQDDISDATLVDYMVFDATRAKDLNKVLQRRYNKRKSEAHIANTHRRGTVKLPFVRPVLDSAPGSADLSEISIPNCFYNLAMAKYFVEHVFKWWVLICEAAKKERLD
jgi:hypothetical protein